MFWNCRMDKCTVVSGKKEWGLMVACGRLECSCTLWKRAEEGRFPVTS